MSKLFILTERSCHKQEIPMCNNKAIAFNVQKLFASLSFKKRQIPKAQGQNSWYAR